MLCVGSLLLLGMEVPTTSGPAVSNPESREKASARSLNFAERVAHQYAIEEVYWHHRIWPKENPGPKPPLNAILSQREIQQQVEAYLRKCQIVADDRGSPITRRELQAEMNRMAQHTKRPEMLRELFAALGNDPAVVAECLARPILAERFTADLAPLAVTPPALGRGFGAETVASAENRVPALANLDYTRYKLPEVSTPDECSDDTWTATSTVNAPDGRILHTTVWTGSELIVWGGVNSLRLNTGGKYDPSTDSWIPTETNNAPSPRDYHSAVWTGSDMIVWGGEPILNTGAKYNPVTNSWATISTTSAPAARAAHTAVWTGEEMIVWGGRSGVSQFNTGGRYNPNTNSWIATSTVNAPEARWYHTAIWIGTEMLVWGGTNQTIYLNTGGRYDPTDDIWTLTTTANAPLGRVGHAAIWSGSAMIIWGGTDSTFNDTNTGSTYNAGNNSWTAISTVDAPSARDSHTAVWTGTEMIVWGGIFCCPAIDFNTGGRYRPDIDNWTATGVANAPLARFYHSGVWTGSEMSIWGGYNNKHAEYLNTGGRYCAESGATPTPTPTATTTPTATPSATATATASPTATPSATAKPTATPTSTPRPTPTPRIIPTPRTRPTPLPRP